MPDSVCVVRLINVFANDKEPLLWYMNSKW